MNGYLYCIETKYIDYPYPMTDLEVFKKGNYYKLFNTYLMMFI